MARKLFGHTDMVAIECEAETPEQALREAAAVIADEGGDVIAFTLGYAQVLEEYPGAEGNGWLATIVIDKN